MSQAQPSPSVAQWPEIQVCCACLVIAIAGTRAAESSPRILLLDGAVVGAEVIAVGERGAILRSADNARTWEAAASPARATLTGVSFAVLAAPRMGWAVGHDAQILATSDAGRTWTRQYQGEDLQDSFLDVLAVDAQRVIAVGAYGLFVVTTNGGRTWTRRKITDDDYHFNRITRGVAGNVYLAGEHGTLLRSADFGASWSAIRQPYEGSLYGVIPLERRTLIAYGLRGHIYHTQDDGETWAQVPTPSPALLATGLRLRNNVLLFAGHAGVLLVSRDGGRTVVSAPAPPASAVAELLELPNGEILALGESGATLLAFNDGGRLAPMTPTP
jgi:photosystem II stability/assembly factor-like uncharacterized protein